MAGSRADSAQDDAQIRRYNHQVLVVTAYDDDVKPHEPQFIIQILIHRGAMCRRGLAASVSLPQWGKGDHRRWWMRCHPRHTTRRGNMCARLLPGGGSRRRRVGEPACMMAFYLAISRGLCHSRASSLRQPSYSATLRGKFALQTLRLPAPSRREPLVREATDGERRGDLQCGVFICSTNPNLTFQILIDRDV